MYDLITVRIVRTKKITTNYLSVQSIGIENTLKIITFESHEFVFDLLWPRTSKTN